MKDLTNQLNMPVRWVITGGFQGLILGQTDTPRVGMNC